MNKLVWYFCLSINLFWGIRAMETQSIEDIFNETIQTIKSLKKGLMEEQNERDKVYKIQFLYRSLINKFNIKDTNIVTLFTKLFTALFNKLDEIENRTDNIFILHQLSNPHVLFLRQLKNIPTKDVKQYSDNLKKTLNLLLEYSKREYITTYLSEFYKFANLQWFGDKDKQKTKEDFLNYMINFMKDIKEILETIETNNIINNQEITTIKKELDELDEFLAMYTGINTQWPPALTRLTLNPLSQYLNLVENVIRLQLLEKIKISATILDRIKTLNSQTLPTLKKNLPLYDIVIEKKIPEPIKIVPIEELQKSLTNLSIELSALKTAAKLPH